MFKYCSVIILSLLLLQITSCSRGDGTVIKGEISNLEYPYILSSYLSYDSLVIDTIPINGNKKFNYKVNIDTLTTFSLYMNNFEGVAVVFADKNENLSVKGDALLPDLIKVRGNEINNDISNFKSENKELLLQRGQLLLNLRLDRQIDTIDSEGENVLTRSEDLSNLNLLNHELMLNAEEYIKENPTKLSSLILINNFFINSDNPAALKRVLGYLDDDVAQTQMAKRLFSQSDKLNRSAEGMPVPYFQTFDKDSVRINSGDFTGKHVLLSFISSNGTESRETVELLKNSYEELNNDSVEFISIYIDSDSYPIESVEEDSIPWTVVTEYRGWGSDIVDNFNVQYIPFNLLISPDGTIKVRNVPAQDVAEEIKKSPEI